MIGPIGEILDQGHSSSQMHPHDYFMGVFHQLHVASIVSYFNEVMVSQELILTTRGENLKFFGVLILMTRIERTCRRSL